ncbi:MAG TPA: alpha/beta hydrolase [Vicinamibacteria bacterium]|nr:alpha/beta hydrolase [Vicinamibacteria bacterium]
MSTGVLPLPTTDPEPRRLALAGGVLAYSDEGPPGAPALIAVHGIPGSGRDFRYLAPQLTPALRVIRIDLPGFGGSTPVADAVATLRGRARAVIALADALGLDRFAVLGHSMGGGTAMVLAAEHPARVSHLVLVASLALRLHRGLGAPPRTFAWIARGLSVPGLREALLPRLRDAYRRRRFPGADEKTAEEFALQFRAFAAVDFGLLRACVRRPLPPALVAYAPDDHMIETPVAEELAAALPGARVLAFDEGGHNLQKNRAVELGEAIREWMDQAGRCDTSAKPISL